MNRYYCTKGKQKVDTLPNPKRVKNVVEFTEKKFCEEIGKEACGYIEYDGVFQNCEDYGYEAVPPKFRRDVRRFDTISALGSSYIVGKVLYCDAYNNEYDPDRSYCDCEFIDIYESYHHWKSEFDGGKVFYYDDGNLLDERIMDSEKRETINMWVNTCIETLLSSGIDVYNDWVYFIIKEDEKAYLYDDYKSLGYVDICGNDDPEFRRLLNIITGLCKNAGFLLFGNTMTDNKPLLLERPFKGFYDVVRNKSLEKVTNKIKVERLTGYEGGLESSKIKRSIRTAWVRKHGILKDVLEDLNEDCYDGSNWEGKYVSSKEVTLLRNVSLGAVVYIYD